MENLLSRAKLCYIDPKMTVAFFTTCPLSKQWGDDWNDAPYEHNAEVPYVRDGYHIYSVYFSTDSNSNIWADITALNKNYSVEQINKKEVPWIVVESGPIYAGATFREFRDKILKSGGAIFSPIRCDYNSWCYGL